MEERIKHRDHTLDSGTRARTTELRLRLPDGWVTTSVSRFYRPDGRPWFTEYLDHGRCRTTGREWYDKRTVHHEEA